MNSADWGKLVFFDTEEHEVTAEKSTLASVPELAAQWKIIFDFKPTEYPKAGSQHVLWMSTLGSDYKIGINLWKGNIFLEVDDWGGLPESDYPVAGIFSDAVLAVAVLLALLAERLVASLLLQQQSHQ